MPDHTRRSVVNLVGGGGTSTWKLFFFFFEAENEEDGRVPYAFFDAPHTDTYTCADQRGDVRSCNHAGELRCPSL